MDFILYLEKAVLLMFSIIGASVVFRRALKDLRCLLCWTPKNYDIVVQGKAVAKTRFPWLHRMFSGWKGWRIIFEKALRKDGHKSLYIVGRFFGHLIFIDASTTQIWLKPRIETTQDSLSIRIGWLYWALCITKRTWYPNPRRYMQGFKDLPYASEEWAQYYWEYDQWSGVEWSDKATVNEVRGD